MALIKCPNCGQDISDKAEKCPNCGWEKNEKKRIARVNLKCHQISILYLVE